MTRWTWRAIWAGLGAALSLINEPFGFWPAAFGALAAAFWLFREKPTIHAFAQGWWFGFGYFAVTFHWIVHPFFVQPDLHGWLFPFGILGLAGGAAIYWGLAFTLANRIRRWGAVDIPTLIVCMTLFEAARGVLFSGFPWGMLAQGFVETGLGQMLAFVGPHGLGLVILLLAALPVIMRIRIGLPLALVAFVGLEVGGQLRLSEPTALRDFTVRLLQANNDQALKFDPLWSNRFFRQNLELSRSAGDFDIVVWPENAVIWDMQRYPDIRENVSAAAFGKPVLLGGNHGVDGSFFNTLAAIGPGGEVLRYSDKVHLVPFGEFIPFRFALDVLGLSDVLPGSYTHGSWFELVHLEGVPTYLSLICYEMIFPRYATAGGARDRKSVV